MAGQKLVVKKMLLLLGVGWCCLSCNKVNSDGSKLEGKYIGYFHRNGQDTARVSFDFSGNVYQGHSSEEAYPVVGTGSFDQNGNTISFNNSIKRAVKVDNSLILKGAYNYQDNYDGSIRIWRQQDETIDEFILRQSLSN